MPIYEFECPSCSERFDRLQKLSDPDPDSCPNCGATGVRRRISAPAFRLAGSGWYETDFKKDGDKKRNLAEKSDGATAESKPADSRSGDAKSSDGKGSDGKSSDGKSGDVKPADAKPAAPASKAEPGGKATNPKSADAAKPPPSGKAPRSGDAS